MKNLIFVLFVIFASLAFCLPSAQAQSQRIEVIDFHSTHRCKTCLNIESTTQAVLNKHFATELKAGKIVFKTLNVDEKANEKIAEKFEATGTALWIYRADTNLKIDLTDFAFMNISNFEKFETHLVKEIRRALR